MPARTGRRSEDREVEITPKMIEAGAVALRRFSHDYESDRAAAVRIYREMRLAILPEHKGAR